MKKKKSKIIAFVLVMAMMLSVTSPVFAVNNGKDAVQPMSSSYISIYGASISGSDGTVTVSFNITAKSKMTSLGATSVQIKKSAGATVKTFYSSSTSGMMGSNRTYFSGSVSYTGISGHKYYAVINYKAANASGSDTCSYTTAYATA